MTPVTRFGDIVRSRRYYSEYFWRHYWGGVVFLPSPLKPTLSLTKWISPFRLSLWKANKTINHGERISPCYWRENFFGATSTVDRLDLSVSKNRTKPLNPSKPENNNCWPVINTDYGKKRMIRLLPPLLWHAIGKQSSWLRAWSMPRSYGPSSKRISLNENILKCGKLTWSLKISTYVNSKILRNTSPRSVSAYKTSLWPDGRHQSGWSMAHCSKTLPTRTILTFRAYDRPKRINTKRKVLPILIFTMSWTSTLSPWNSNLKKHG
jgi:hypothetical protein